MSTQAFRLPAGGLVDRSRRLGFTFNGRRMEGFAGDTLAAALLANGQRLVARSFKYHRPRGILSAGSEEPNALVTLRQGAAAEPNIPATMVELFDGLAASSQNHRGPLEFDLLAVNDLLSPFLAAGFYYKTFMWPKSFWEKLYEPVIRASAGLGRLSGKPDPDAYDHGFLHCDVLVTGAGPAGLAAALAAARAGARVIIADEDFLPGGRLNAETHQVEGQPGHAWAAAAWAELSGMANVRTMTRTTVFGVYDHGIHGALERRTDHLANADGRPRQVLWRIYARRSVLAAGATERAIAFPMNDRPGIMLAGAVRSYLNRHGVTPGRRVAVFTCNDDGWRTARDLQAAGVEVAAVIDSRPEASARIEGVPFHPGAGVADTRGRKGLKSLRLTNGQTVVADCLAVAGGWSPNVQLSCHHRNRPVWREDIAAFVPGPDLPPGMIVAGAANGTLTLGAALVEGQEAGNAAAGALGFRPSRSRAPSGADEPSAIVPLWEVKGARKRAWIDLQNDVTTKDVRQANQEGYRSVELVKRYTTMGMATDQGKTGNVAGIGVLAEARGQGMAETGTTIYRPPYTPVAIGAFAGRARGRDFRPVRLTPSHRWAEEMGATFVETGLWLRAQWFARPGEKGWRDSVDREVEMTRRSVGICDVTTLGKIDIQGRDAAVFLDRVYANPFLKVPVGRVRYGLMLREDGFAYDDGTCARLSETHYVMTTTTANAGLVFRNLEFARQCLWPELDVHLISITDGWAQFAIAGPNSRALLAKIVDDIDLSNEAFPFMACAECTICGGTPARLFRISFSGELAYELAVPARYGDALPRVLMAAGEEFDVVPYGTEALAVMRIEKGHAAGNELNGQTTAHMLGMGRMVSLKKDAIGTVLSQRPEMIRADAPRLMGFRPVNRAETLSAGAHFIGRDETAPSLTTDQGWMSSVAFSPELGHYVGLGFITRGHERLGEIVRAHDPLRGRDTLVEIVSPHHLDPEGVRQRG
ncbi:MAG: sarcosine oxidase subunit alpha family protein [Alphaproteobacteria bacterium]|nr:MAG: sarcosine oxidase subunit alpha family protein [Alphaproteobacteria bacterium]